MTHVRSPESPFEPLEWSQGEYVISTDPARLDVDAVLRFLATSYWASERRPEVIRRSLEHSLTFGVYHGSKQIGMARVVTDYATFAWLCDVFIDPAYRGHGLGKWLMATIMSHPELQDLRQWLLATRDAHGLYRQVGFTEIPNPARWMLKREDPFH